MKCAIRFLFTIASFGVIGTLPANADQLHEETRKILEAIDRGDNSILEAPKTAEEPRQKLVATSIDKIRIPNRMIKGTLKGEPFEIDSITFEDNILFLRQGTDFFADKEVTIFLFLPDDEKLEGKSILVHPDSKIGDPHVHVKWRKKDAEVREMEAYTQGYALKIEFAPKRSGKLLAGRLYLVLPDEQKSRIAGSFAVEYAAPKPKAVPAAAPAPETASPNTAAVKPAPAKPAAGESVKPTASITPPAGAAAAALAAPPSPALQAEVAAATDFEELSESDAAALEAAEATVMDMEQLTNLSPTFWALFGLGWALSLVASIWIVVISFKRHWAWGLACFIFPPAALIFIILNLKVTYRPVLVSALGTAMIIGGVFLQFRDSMGLITDNPLALQLAMAGNSEGYEVEEPPSDFNLANQVNEVESNGALQAGDPESKVYREYGKPMGTMKMGRESALMYQDGEVWILDGKVSKIMIK